MVVREGITANDEQRVGLSKECSDAVNHLQKWHPSALVILEVRRVDEKLLFIRDRIAAKNRSVGALDPVNRTVKLPEPRPPDWQFFILDCSKVEKRFTGADKPIEKRYLELL